MNASSIHEINISQPSFFYLIIRPIHYLVFLISTGAAPVAMGLLLWRLWKGLPINTLLVACAALGPWLLVYSFRRLSTLRGAATWQLVTLAVTSAAAFAFAEASYSRMPSSEADLPGNSDAYMFLIVVGVLLPIQSALQWWLQRTMLPTLEAPVSTVTTEPSGAAIRVRSISPVKGYLFAGFGLLFLALQTLAELSAAILEREYDKSLFFYIGIVLLFRSRRYFQADADALLSVDRRPPVLLLRSFADDAKGGWRLSWNIWRLLDYSLELRLARHFTHYGPFVAVGTPNEGLPQIGAARKSFGEGEWQDAVLTWAKSAQLISIFIGSTHWVNWEVSQVVSLNLTDRLILLTPESRTWLPWRHNATMAERIATLTKALANTPWRESMANIGDAGNIRAIVLAKDGNVIVIRSMLRSRDSYHLGALIAHHLILRQRKNAQP